MSALVALERATVGYRGRALLNGVDLVVDPGAFLAMVGPNGGGKTTVLRSLLGALPLLGGRLVRPRPVRVGYVPQRDHVDAVWPFTAGEVALMGRVPGLGPWRRPGAEDREAVRRAMATVGIEHLVDMPYGEMSGGQRQRTLIARALAAEPELLVLDEPTNGMDPAAELATMDLLRALHRAGGLAIVMVSHRLEAVANYAQALAFVDKDQTLFRVGSLEEMLRPEALGALYGRPVAVREFEGRRILYPVNGAGGAA
ncbi:metal ABC transporter ATP-binding protein [Anaeromyxobacter oryzae]|uniref:ABC transporter ATP-binding protein n=1 Tax=Anaeromyxobacter oryzae TaxID=2918170 RepID=A0ABN6MPH9_9BACT|nr:metal ABC transporter ATP-binding protein [Anaeromyxobacter oryzae]BDG01559.1 ABC transporter ATP-binding protein [Anaeromyxobacter oryzae]